MPNLSTGLLPSAGAPLSTDIFALVRSGQDMKAFVAELFDRDLALGSKRDFGCVGDGITNDTTNLQTFCAFEGEVGRNAKLMILESGTYKYTTPLVGTNGGQRIQGVGSGNNFWSILQPTDCAAFDLTVDKANSVYENLMIWPKGTTPPAFFIRLDGAGDIRFQNVRIHLASTYQCTEACVIQQNTATRTLGTIFDRVTIRTDGAVNFPIGYKFKNNCGSVTLLNTVTETCDIAFQHDGGNVTMFGGTSERCDTLWNLQPSADAYASFHVLGGAFGAAASGYPIKIRDGCKSTQFKGCWIFNGSQDVPTAPVTQGAVYGLGSSAKNIVLDLANFDASLWAFIPALDPKIITFRGVNRPMPGYQFTSVSVTVGTLAADLITGAQVVRLLNTNNTPGNQTVRTAAQMIADMVNCLPGDTYMLEIANTGTGTLTLLTATGVTLSGTMTVAQNTMRTFKVTVDSSSTMTILSVGSIAYAA